MPLMTKTILFGKKIISCFVLVFFDFLLIHFFIWLALLGRNTVFIDSVAEPVAFKYLLEEGITLQLTLLLMAILAFEGLYNARNTFSEEFRRIVKAGFLFTIIIGFYVYIFKLDFYFSRLTIVLFSFLFIGLFPFFRRFCKSCLFHLGLWRKEAWLVGDIFPDVLTKILADPVLGYRVKTIPLKDLDAQLIKTELLTQPLTSRDLIVSVHQVELGKLAVFLQAIEFNFENVKVFNRFYSAIFSFFNLERNSVAGFFTFKRKLIKPHSQILKRVFDLVISLVTIVLLTPFFIVAIVSLKIVQGGNPFFSQERIGKNGKTFKLWKFKTMVDNSDKVLEEYFQKHPQEKEEYLRFHKFKNLKQDPRLTFLGRFFRRWSLDELPQFFNVLIGDMSIVGPRPYLPGELADTDPQKRSLILMAKPALTGLWQVMGRNEIDFLNRLLLDEYYVRNWDFMLDLEILFRTPGVVGRGF